MVAYELSRYRVSLSEGLSSFPSSRDMEERKQSVSPLPSGVPQIASHHERMINEVEGSDGQLGAILR